MVRCKMHQIQLTKPLSVLSARNYRAVPLQLITVSTELACSKVIETS